MESRINTIVDEYTGQKTLLLLDACKAEESLKIFENSSKFVVFDAKMMHTKRVTRHQSIPSLLEEARHLLTFSIMRGRILVVRLGDAAVDFKSTFCDEACEDIVSNNPRPPYQQWDYLPRGFILQSGEMLKTAPFPDSLFRREDMADIENGNGVRLHPDFRVIVSTTIPEDRFDDLLFNGRYGLPGMKLDYDIVKL